MGVSLSTVHSTFCLEPWERWQHWPWPQSVVGGSVDRVIWGLKLNSLSYCDFWALLTHTDWELKWGACLCSRAKWLPWGCWQFVWKYFKLEDLLGYLVEIRPSLFLNNTNNIALIKSIYSLMKYFADYLLVIYRTSVEEGLALTKAPRCGGAPGTPAPRRWRQADQKVNVILSYVVSLRLAWTT